MDDSGFVDALGGTIRGRPKPVRRKRKPGARRPLSAIATDARKRPQDPAQVRALVRELREHRKWNVVATSEQAPLRLTLASLVAGAHTAYETRAPSRTRVGRAQAQVLMLALADARVLLADLIGERAGDFERVLASGGAQHGTLSGAALERHRRQLAEDRELLP
jgi:hypothetical protein